MYNNINFATINSLEELQQLTMTDISNNKQIIVNREPYLQNRIVEFELIFQKSLNKINLLNSNANIQQINIKNTLENYINVVSLRLQILKEELTSLKYIIDLQKQYDLINEKLFLEKKTTTESIQKIQNDLEEKKEKSLLLGKEAIKINEANAMEGMINMLFCIKDSGLENYNKLILIEPEIKKYLYITILKKLEGVEQEKIIETILLKLNEIDETNNKEIIPIDWLNKQEQYNKEETIQKEKQKLIYYYSIKTKIEKDFLEIQKKLNTIAINDTILKELLQSQLANIQEKKLILNQTIKLQIQIYKNIQSTGPIVPSQDQILELELKLEILDEIVFDLKNSEQYYLLNGAVRSSNIIEEINLQKINFSNIMDVDDDLDIKYMLESVANNEEIIQDIMRSSQIKKPFNDLDKVYKTNLCEELLKTNKSTHYSNIVLYHATAIKKAMQDSKYFDLSDLQQNHFRKQYTEEYGLDERALELYIKNNIVSLTNFYLTPIEKKITVKYLKDVDYNNLKPSQKQKTLNQIQLFLEIPKYINEIAYNEMINGILLINHSPTF